MHLLIFKCNLPESKQGRREHSSAGRCPVLSDATALPSQRITLLPRSVPSLGVRRPFPDRRWGHLLTAGREEPQGAHQAGEHRLKQQREEMGGGRAGDGGGWVFADSAF